jgi:hypothetical protein
VFHQVREVDQRLYGIDRIGLLLRGHVGIQHDQPRYGVVAATADDNDD